MIILNGTSGIRFPLSTAASPSVSNTTSSDTGIYYPTSTILGFATAGAEQMRIDSSGNVGIGTASSTAKLSVNGGASTSQIRWEVNNSTYTQEVSTNAAQNAYVYKANDASFHTWKVSGSEVMRLGTSGYLGINLGGTNPADILDVYRSGQGTTGITTRSNSGTSISLASNRGGGGNNPLTQAGDGTIIYSAGAINTGSLVIGQWSGIARGIRLTSAGQVGVAQADPDSFAGSAPFTMTVGTIRPVTIASGYSGNGIYGGTINFNSVIDTSVNPATFSVPGTTLQRGGATLAGFYDGSFIFYNYNTGSDTGGVRTVNLTSAFRMILDSNGNVGIGTDTPVAPLVVARSSFIPQMGFLRSGIGTWYVGGDNVGTDNNFHINLNAATTFFTIDTGGYVGIGTNAPTAKFDISGGSLGNTVGSQIIMERLTSYNSNSSFLDFSTIRDGTNPSWLSAGSRIQQKIDSTWMSWMQFNGDTNAGGMAFGTGTSTGGPLAIPERMRITPQGYVLVGAGTYGGIGLSLAVPDASGCYSFLSGSSAGYHWRFGCNDTGAVGSISTSGSVTTYATSSDYRLKHDIAPMVGALSKVVALKPVIYKWNADDSHGEGFIAHELAEVVPQCVIGEKDAVDADGKPEYQGVDTSFLVATLTAAIQEQQALIEQQQSVIDNLISRITALEAQGS